MELEKGLVEETRKEENVERVKIEKTRTGKPALWECGGRASNTGDCQIIAGIKGERLKPLYVVKSGPRANLNHALFAIRKGIHVLRGYYEENIVVVYKILKVDEEEAICKEIGRFEKGEWKPIPPKFLNEAIAATFDKMSCYHCRETHYSLPL